MERYEQDNQRNMECVTIEYNHGKDNQSIELEYKGLLPEKDALDSFSETARLSDPLEGKFNITNKCKFK